MDTWIWVVVALLIGALLGGLGVYLFARRRWADAARAEELQRELDGYRQEVSDHFVQTAGLVNDLTRSYKAVYDHLEQGAYRLVDEETLRKQLGDVDAETVRLEYIGRRNKAAVLGSGAKTCDSVEQAESTGPNDGPTYGSESGEQEPATGWETTSTGTGHGAWSEEHEEPGSTHEATDQEPAPWGRTTEDEAATDATEEREKAARADGQPS